MSDVRKTPDADFAPLSLADPKPDNDDTPPMPAPTWKPEVKEPEPDRLPDEEPAPNPDESRDPPQHL